MSTYTTAGEPTPAGTDLSAAPLETAAPDASNPAPAPGPLAPAPGPLAPAADTPVTDPAPAPDAAAPALPAPTSTGFPEPATGGDTTVGGTVVTDTGTPTFPQPMPAAPAGHVNLATVPPMTSLTVPPDADTGTEVVIDVYGTTVDDATAERAHAAAATAGLRLREL